MKTKKLLSYCLLPALCITMCMYAGCSGSRNSGSSVGKQKDNGRYADYYIIGENERVEISDRKITYKARIDTGATTCSIHATDIVEFVRDGKNWARFSLLDFKTGEKVTIEKPISRIASIKRHGAKDQRRVAVKMPIWLGPISDVVEFTLTDRSKFEYPALIGRNFLSGNVLVDTNLSYTGGIPVEMKQ